MVRALISAVLMTLLLLRAVPASAQEQGLGGSFITPFPDNDVYQVQVVGDWLAEGLMGGLVQAFTAGPGVSISRKRYDLDGLMRNSSANDMAQLEQTFGTDPSHIAIVMLGAQDRYSVNRRRTTEAETDEWRGEYGARVDRLMKLLKKNNRAVYWVGLPNMRRWQDNERAQRMNDVIRERAYLNGVRFIDAYASFIDESGGYSDWGPDVTGKVRRLRDSDGVHFTEAGYLKLAHFVERELKRDVTQARTERSIPLAGDAAEQSRVNPEKVRLKAESDRAQAQAKSAKGGGGGIAAPAASAAAADGARDQKLETGKVDIKVPGAEGTEQIVTIEIVRPAIPASVVALVTRKTSDDKAAQMGDVLVDQIPGGLTVTSSIVPPRGSDGSRRRMSPTQSPYFRVLEKGERLPSKPGRADDFTWPRQQTTAEVSSEPPPMTDGRRGSTASTR
ncbi:MAG: GDSL-type esterase/lipase family protein [Hyphomicrobium sp.]|nr:GDSL-type esterase/lipase family protein [Hyphomicrobium sp.]